MQQSGQVEASIVEQDIACIRCGYNLRGLDPDGLCPECSHMVRLSIELWEQDRRDASLVRSDPRWIRNLAEGAILALIAFALIMLLALAPDWAYAWKSPQRDCTLGVACSAWVLMWGAAWKLGIRSSDAVSREGEPVHLRISATVYLSLPFLRELLPPNAFLLVVLVFGIIAGGVVSGTLLWRVSELAAAGSAKVLSGEAQVLAVLNVFALIFFVLMPSFDREANSLAALMVTVFPAYGVPVVLREAASAAAAGRLLYWRWPYWLLLVLSALAVWNAIVFARLSVLLLTTAQRIRQRNT